VEIDIADRTARTDVLYLELAGEIDFTVTVSPEMFPVTFTVCPA